jgi:hypothetical protein
MCNCKNDDYEKLLELAQAKANEENTTMVVYKKGEGGANLCREKDFDSMESYAITLVLPRLSADMGKV